MKASHLFLCVTEFAFLLLMSCRTTLVKTDTRDMLVRISEIEIYPDSLRSYNTILKEEAEASIRLEPGVISIFPMYEQKDSTQIRILEIYADTKAYRTHLQTPHFKKYKSSTLSMVKSLRLIDMQVIDAQTMKKIFTKTGQVFDK